MFGEGDCYKIVDSCAFGVSKAVASPQALINGEGYWHRGNFIVLLIVTPSNGGVSEPYINPWKIPPN